MASRRSLGSLSSAYVWGVLGISWGPLGASWGYGASWSLLGASSRRLRTPWALSGHLGGPWSLPEASPELPGTSLGPLGSLFGPLWELSGTISGPSQGLRGSSEAEKRNLQKHMVFLGFWIDFGFLVASWMPLRSQLGASWRGLELSGAVWTQYGAVLAASRVAWRPS